MHREKFKALPSNGVEEKWKLKRSIKILSSIIEPLTGVKFSTSEVSVEKTGCLVEFNFDELEIVIGLLILRRIIMY